MSKKKERNKTKLLPHQKRLLKKVKDNNKVLAYWGLGSGKTLGSLAAAEESKGDTSIIGPASLKGNFKQQKKEHGIKEKTDYSTYSKPEPKSKDFLIFDEAHRMGRQESQRSKYPEKFKAKKTIMLTGTPIRNEPSELIPLLRGIDVDVPKSKEKFYDKYVTEKKINPGFLGRLKGIKPGVERDGKNILELAEKLKGKVDYHKNSKEGYPEVNERTIQVPMSKKQLETYEMAMNEKPSLAYKIKHGIPPSKEESSSMNAFLTATRQISNTPSSYNESTKGIKDAPKLQRMAEDIEEKYKKDKNYKGVTYSNYLDSGVKPLASALDKKGIPYATFTGETSKKDRKKIVEDYNKGKIKHLLISGAGSEGLDLKGTKMLQVMEPHWNEARIDQVKGRPIRYKSHAHLPKGERKIDVREYQSVHPDNDKSTTDQYISQLAEKKEELNKDFKNALILGSALSIEDKSDKVIVQEKLKENKKMDKLMKKQAANRLVKELSKKSPDEIAKFVRKNNLGDMLHGKSIKTIGGGGEGVAELAGDAQRGVKVRKYTDMKSPITSVKSMIDKVKSFKVLNKDPKTKDHFVEYIPKSFSLSSNKGVAKMETSYSKGMGKKYIKPGSVDEMVQQSERNYVQQKATDVVGKEIFDIAENPGNYNATAGEVVDFLTEEARKGGEDIQMVGKVFKKKQGKGGKIDPRLWKAYKGSPRLRNTAKELQKVLDKSDASAKHIKFYRPPNAKGMPYPKYVKKLDEYEDVAWPSKKEERLSKLKKDFYS